MSQTIHAGDHDILPTYSRDDEGWYCDVIKVSSGAEVFSTGVYPNRSDAVNEAQEWLKLNA